jgi:hypothetical protein
MRGSVKRERAPRLRLSANQTIGHKYPAVQAPVPRKRVDVRRQNYTNAAEIVEG